MRKRSVFAAALFSLVSTVSGQGYGQAVNQTLNPESMQHVYTMWQTLGWHLAAILAAPLAVVFFLGYPLGEWKNNEDYWVLVFFHLAVAFAAILVYPLILLNL